MSWDWEKLKTQQQKKGELPPQLEDLFKKFNQFKMPGGFSIIVVLVVLALLLGSTMFYTVAVDEVGVVQRFGRYVRQTNPGLNFKLPMGIERVTNVKVRRIYKEEFGFETLRVEGGNTRVPRGSDENSTSLMLTGDLNVAVVPWIVQYRIKDPYNYLFKVADVTQLLRDMSESSMRLVVGDRSINEVISKREEIAQESKAVLQKELDQAETGIHVETIEMKRTNVPGPVQPSFNEVNQATQDREKLIYEAREEYNKVIPSARGEKDQIIKGAEGYKLERVNRAQGDAARFKSLYAEYQKAPEVTRRRLYLESMKTVLPNMGEKYIVDEGQKNLLPLLNLGRKEGQ